MSEGKELADWQQALAAGAKQQLAIGGGEGLSYISIKNANMKVDGDPVPGNKLQCIVLAAVVERSLYTSNYDPDNIVPPDCFALGHAPKGLVPHENVVTPQCDNCDGCPKAVFGSAPVGKGPACKTRIRLIVMPMTNEGLTPDAIANGDLGLLKVAPTSTKHWTKYANKLAGQGLAPWAALTEIIVEADDKWQHTISYRGVQPINDSELLPVIYGRTAEAEEHAMRPWDLDEE